MKKGRDNDEMVAQVKQKMTPMLSEAHILQAGVERFIMPYSRV